MVLYEVATDDLVRELKARFDSSCFCGVRNLTREKNESLISWSGDSKVVCGALFQAAYAIAHDVVGETK